MKNKFQPERTGHDPRLLLLLSATDMLAACAEGKNLFIESICQNIFSLEELIEYVINCPCIIHYYYLLLSTIGSQLPPLRKRPFVRFLIWVYMKTADDKDENRKFSLKHGKYVIDYDHKSFYTLGVMYSYREQCSVIICNFLA